MPVISRKGLDWVDLICEAADARAKPRLLGRSGVVREQHAVAAAGRQQPLDQPIIESLDVADRGKSHCRGERPGGFDDRGARGRADASCHHLECFAGHRVATFCREQAYCHLSPALVRNLETHWNAHERHL